MKDENITRRIIKRLVNVYEPLLHGNITEFITKITKVRYRKYNNIKVRSVNVQLKINNMRIQINFVGWIDARLDYFPLEKRIFWLLAKITVVSSRPYHHWNVDHLLTLSVKENKYLVVLFISWSGLRTKMEALYRVLYYDTFVSEIPEISILLREVLLDVHKFNVLSGVAKLMLKHWATKMSCAAEPTCDLLL